MKREETTLKFKKGVRKHFDDLAEEYDGWKEKNAYYYSSLKRYIKTQVHPGKSVLDVGCATGALLYSACPARGVGVDISSNMIARAQKKYPSYTFICSDIENLNLDETFDYILIVDVIDHVEDHLAFFQSLKRFCHAHTRIILSTINPLWGPLLHVMENFKAKMPEGPHQFVRLKTLHYVTKALGFEVLANEFLLLFPKKIPVISEFVNRYMTKVIGIKRLSCVQTLILKPYEDQGKELPYGVSVIIPCFNEEDNIEELICQIPDLSIKREIIVVNDGSTDKTAERVSSIIARKPGIQLIDIKINQGKANAIQQGILAAQKECVIVVDGDNTIPPEEIGFFYQALVQRRASFINGTRMILPQEKQAMPFINYVGNRIIARLVSLGAGLHLSDALCGSKAFFKKDFEALSWGLDPWGDLDLIFHAAKKELKVLEMPVHYRQRRSGKSKMNVVKHFLNLIKGIIKGFFHLKDYSTRRSKIE